MYAILYSLYCGFNGTNFNFLALLELEKMLTLINEENFEILIFQKILSSEIQKGGNIVSNVCNRSLSLLRSQRYKFEPSSIVRIGENANPNTRRKF